MAVGKARKNSSGRRTTIEIDCEQSFEEAAAAVESFSGTANGFVEILSEMHVVAQDAAGGSYSGEELERMQDELEQLADRINSMVETMVCSDQTMQPGHPCSAVVVAAGNIRIDTACLDLRADAEAAACTIAEALNRAATYCDYLSAQKR
jgi:hypothetical protein